MPVTVKFWVVVEAQRRSWGTVASNGLRQVDNVKAKELRQNKPQTAADQEAVEIEITFPDGYFDANSPKIVVQVPPDPVVSVPITTVAQVKGRKPSRAAAIVHGGED